MLVFAQIFKQALRITREHKFLWIFGPPAIASMMTSIIIAQALRAGLFFSFKNYLLSAVGIILFLIFIRCWLSLIIAVKATLDKQETSIKKSLIASKFFFWRSVDVVLYVYSGLALLAAVLILPVIYLLDHNLPTQAWSLAGLAVIIYLPVLAVGLLVGFFAPLFIIIYDLLAIEARLRAFGLVSKSWSELIAGLVLLMFIDLPALFLARFMVGLRGGFVVLVMAGIVFLLFQSIFIVFQQTVWILVFQELVKPQKLEDAEPVVMPEIV